MSLTHAATPGDVPEEPPLAREEDRRVARICLSVLGVLSTGSLIGVASSLFLVTHYPLLLVALSPLGRHLVLAAPVVDPVAFVVVAVTRRMLFYYPCFRLGGAYGRAGIAWVEARAARIAEFIRWIERIFQRAPRLVVLCMTGPTVSALAGSSGMAQPTYLALAGLGLLVRVLLVLAFGELARAPIEAVLAFIGEYWVPGTVLIVAAIAVQRWRHKAFFGPPWA